ncbi:ribonuclease HI [Glaciihabitans tibetensis]|uniref:ribonuclease H n=1 Tax=Glaciihabitans tibetensis TaxID=1266600 RepID=A0A2T0VCG5_9MICO|nr:RNase H family protein [Glaciihabitans tibetensis]PRY67872.1 ribonuclease HI [Glaciihabitans tibetensis]
MTIRAAADGSALGNPGPAGWAWYVDDACWAAGGWRHATNNQGELMAVLQFFRATAHLDDDLLILCDSQYVINSVTKWMPGWKKKGWKKADGKPVLNLELLQEIDAALVGRKYRFEWVKGHANHPLNEAADSRARAVSEAFQRGRPIPTGPGWTREGDAAAPVSAPADGSGLPANAGGAVAGRASASLGTRSASGTGSAAGGSASVAGSASGASSAAVVPGATAAARAARNAAAGQPLSSTQPATAARRARTGQSAPSLFDFDASGGVASGEDAAAVEVSLTLDRPRYDKLRAIAARDGITVEEALARLI